MYHFLFVFSIAALLSGCMATNPYNQAAYQQYYQPKEEGVKLSGYKDKVIKGKTTTQEVLNTYGKPFSKGVTGDNKEHYTFSYSNTWYEKGTSGQVLKTHIYIQTLVVNFLNGVVEEVSFSELGKKPDTIASAGSINSTGGSSTGGVQKQANIPQPIEGVSGKYKSPYTSDDTVAGWVEKARKVGVGSSVGGAVGSYAASNLLEQVPFVGSFLGNKVGKSAGRAVVLNSIGGNKFIEETSDLSFNSGRNMGKWLHHNFKNHSDYAEVIKLTGDIYPDIKQFLIP